jgi:dTDP-4-amino-4,6-dideoxygalactose transaminase
MTFTVGATPLTTETRAARSLPLSRPDLREEDIARAAEVLRTGMLVQGQHVAELERAVRDLLAADVQVLAVSSGTAALHLALVALGVGPGDEVIVPAFSFVATANVVELVGATPVFVDIDAATNNVDVDQLAEAIGPRTKAIMPVHEFGLACAIDRVIDIASAHGIPVVEDAACALGATFGGRAAGTFGALGCFSLHPRKAVTSGEGGLVVTADAAVAARIARLRNHGIAEVDGVKEFVEAGYNYRLTEFQAVLVASQLMRLPRNLEYRARLAAAYEARLDSSAVSLPAAPEGRRHAWQTFHVLLADRIDRPALMRALHEAGIQTSLGAQCIPAQRFYQNKYGIDSARRFPNAFRAWRQGLALPMSEHLTLDDVAYVAEHVNRLTA